MTQEQLSNKPVDIRQEHEDNELAARGLAEKAGRILNAYWHATKAIDSQFEQFKDGDDLVRTVDRGTSPFKSRDGTEMMLAMYSVTENPDEDSQKIRTANFTLFHRIPNSREWGRIATVYSSPKEAHIELEEYGHELYPDMLDSDVVPVVDMALDVAETQLFKRRNGPPEIRHYRDRD